MWVQVVNFISLGRFFFCQFFPSVEYAQVVILNIVKKPHISLTGPCIDCVVKLPLHHLHMSIFFK